MTAWLETLVGPTYAGPASWIAAVIVIALLLYVFFRISRRYSSGTYVAGGRNRKARLAIVDAASVDGHRRLVLVRRDDVEHLILIGGANDVVVEQHIRNAVRPAARPPQADEQPEPAPSKPTAPAKPAEQPVPMQAAPVVSPAISERRASSAEPLPPAARPEVPQAQAPHVAPRAATLPPLPPIPPRTVPVSGTTAPPRIAPLPASGSSHAPRPATEETRPPLAESTAPSRPVSEPDFDEALMQELEDTLDKAAARTTQPDNEVEDEMARLLGSLAPERR